MEQEHEVAATVIVLRQNSQTGDIHWFVMQANHIWPLQKTGKNII